MEVISVSPPPPRPPPLWLLAFSATARQTQELKHFPRSVWAFVRASAFLPSIFLIRVFDARHAECVCCIRMLAPQLGKTKKKG